MALIVPSADLRVGAAHERTVPGSLRASGIPGGSWAVAAPPNVQSDPLAPASAAGGRLQAHYNPRVPHTRPNLRRRTYSESTTPTWWWSGRRAVSAATLCATPTSAVPTPAARKASPLAASTASTRRRSMRQTSTTCMPPVLPPPAPRHPPPGGIILPGAPRTAIPTTFHPNRRPGADMDLLQLHPPSATHHPPLATRHPPATLAGITLSQHNHRTGQGRRTLNMRRRVCYSPPLLSLPPISLSPPPTHLPGRAGTGTSGSAARRALRPRTTCSAKFRSSRSGYGPSVPSTWA